MTLLSRCLAFFPTLVSVMAGASLISFIIAPSLLKLVVFLFILYGFPLSVYHGLNCIYPLKSGISYLDEKIYSPWWGSHQIQAIYIAFPQLESLLQLIPGLFSVWLRLWGSSVGRHVYWTSRVEIADRGLMKIGRSVIFGHKIECYGHTIKIKNNRLILYVRNITIGNDVFIGAGSRMGPGVIIEDGIDVPILTDLFMNRHVKKEHPINEKTNAG